MKEPIIITINNKANLNIHKNNQFLLRKKIYLFIVINK